MFVRGYKGETIPLRTKKIGQLFYQTDENHPKEEE
jgi:hypothetical protein